MFDLYKVSEHWPNHTKNGISITLIEPGVNKAGIKINEGEVLRCEYRETYPVEVNETKFTIQLNNTFIEHWGRVVKCYVFLLKSTGVAK